MSGRRRRRANVEALDLTMLAWRRTTFQVALAALATARMLETRLGWWVLTAGLAGAALALAVHASAASAVAAIDSDGEVVPHPRGFGHPVVRQALVAGATASLALAALAWVVLQA